MANYKAGADRANRLQKPRGLGPQSEGPAGPCRHLDLIRVRVRAPHFMATLTMAENRCIEAAKTLQWAIGMQTDDLRAELHRRGYTATIHKRTTTDDYATK